MLRLSTEELHQAIRFSETLVVCLASDVDFNVHVPGVVFARIEPGLEGEVAALFGIVAGPALMIFREGIGLYLRPGQHDAKQVAHLLNRVLALNMADVKASLERERSETAVNVQRMCPATRRGPLL